MVIGGLSLIQGERLIQLVVAGALAGGLHLARGVAAYAATPLDSTVQTETMLPTMEEPTADLADPRLPARAPMSITIQVNSSNVPARQRASDISLDLSLKGIYVAALVASPHRIDANTVAYFYAEDKVGAEVIARSLGGNWRPVQRRIAPHEALPRPGALELGVGSP